MNAFVRLFAVAMTAATLYAGAAVADDTHYVLQVDGLNCLFCGSGIEKQLEKLDGVENAQTELGLERIFVQVVDDATLSEETVRDIIRDAGFTLTHMTRHKDRRSARGESERVTSVSEFAFSADRIRVRRGDRVSARPLASDRLTLAD